MTWAKMGCTPAETERRQKVAERLNKLCYKRDFCTADDGKRKRINRTIKGILRQERPWLKEYCFFLY